jgi:hypothetical protein
MVQPCTTMSSCNAILCVSLVSFATTTLCVASQRIFIIIVVYFVIDSVRKILGIPSCMVVSVTCSSGPSEFKRVECCESASQRTRNLYIKLSGQVKIWARVKCTL